MAGLTASTNRVSQRPAVAALKVTEPLKPGAAAREGSGEWLLREFARSNQKFTSFKAELERPWWQLW